MRNGGPPIPVVIEVKPENMPVMKELRGFSAILRCAACMRMSDRRMSRLTNNFKAPLSIESKTQKPKGCPSKTPRYIQTTRERFVFLIYMRPCMKFPQQARRSMMGTMLLTS